MTRCWIAAICLLLAMMASASVSATPAGLCPKGGPIRYAHYEFGLLYTPEFGGIDEDIRRELEKRSGCRFQTSLRPRARIWLDLARGDLDMAGSGIQTSERDTFAWFAHYVLEDNQVVLGPRVPAELRDWSAFQAEPALKLGGVRSFSYSPFYDEQVDAIARQGRFVPVSDVRTLYRLFAHGQLDALIGSQFLIGHYQKHLKLPPLRIEDWDPAPATPSGLVISKRRFTAAQARAWKALMREMLQDGTVLRIVSQYLPKEQAARLVYQP